jgi:hypothetical protein
MAKSKIERILILAKTYPSPSSKYIETSCVAGINEQGLMRRLYPVPFRLINGDKQFKKWQWVTVRIEKNNKDHRPESHKIYTDTISCESVIDKNNEWLKRRVWIDKLPYFNSFAALEAAGNENSLSLALLHPKQLIGLEISKARNSDWTEEEKNKLIREQLQDDLFTEEQAKDQIRQLRKVPFDFYYRYVCDTEEGEKEHRHKIVDWEAGQLYWNCLKSYGDNWEMPFRAKLQDDLGKKDLMFLMGNQHRFQDQWLIISLIYPPKRRLPEVEQYSLF